MDARQPECSRLLNMGVAMTRPQASRRFHPRYRRFAAVAVVSVLLVSPAGATETDSSGQSQQGIAPDLRKEPPPVSARKGNFVVVPIPFSNPTLDTGLVIGAAYFHPQSEAQEAVQPPSVTGVGAMYSSNDSRAAAIGHAAYWSEDRWRFNGIYADADLELPLLGPGEGPSALDLNWAIEGNIMQAEIARRVGGRWFLGFSVRYMDISQTFEIDVSSSEFDLGNSLQSAGLGLSLSFDTRDMTTNAYEGRYFQARAQNNFESFGSDEAYQSYSLAYRQYHALRPRFVLAWELYGCAKSDGVPLWDACRIGLRGFAATDYLGKSALRGQAEGRWRLGERWGAVAFAGAGWMDESFSGQRDDDLIPSYGVGLRFMVQKSNRINLRLDYGRSRDSDAVTLSVMEAF